MPSEDTADYVAAAIAYALLDNYLQFTSDVRRDFQDLIVAKYDVLLPREIIIPALKILHNANVIVLNDDRYRPLVHIPTDYRSKVGVWRFVERDTPAAGILDRFMDGPHDWMQHILQSEDFSNDLVEEYGLASRDSSREKREIDEGEPLVLSKDERNEEELVGTDPVMTTPQLAHVHIQNSISLPLGTVPAPPTDKSSSHATWTSAWAGWASALIALASLVLALHVAKAF